MTDTAQIFQFPSAPEAQRSKRGAQLEDGYTRTANELVDGFMKAPLTSHEARIIRAFERATFGWNQSSKWLAASVLSQMTELPAGKCSEALNSLIRKRVIIREGGSRSPARINTVVSEWDFSAQKARVTPKQNGNPKRGKSPQNGVGQSPQNGVANKDRKDSMNTYVFIAIRLPANWLVDLAAQPVPAKPKKPGKAKLPSCPHGDLLDLWAEIMPDKRQPIRSMWSKGARSKNLAARWKQGFSIKHEQTGEPLYTDTESGIAWWGKFFAFLRKSEFLMRDDSRFFGLDWIAKAENFEKIMELKYHGGDA